MIDASRHWMFRAVVAAGAGLLAAPAARAGATNEVGALTHIHALLMAADHDYKGHKQAALNAIDDACKAMNLNIHSNAHGHELQGDSDKMLRQAGLEVESLLPVAQENTQERVVKDLHKATEQIQKALEVK